MWAPPVPSSNLKDLSPWTCRKETGKPAEKAPLKVETLTLAFVPCGTVTVSGSQITFYPNTGNYKASDTCVGKNNFQRAMTSSELQAEQGETWGWEIDASSGQPKLYTGPGGPSEFRRP